MLKLTEKQKRFADYYIETGNATESAIKAGYSEKTAAETGYENLRKPHIKAYIDQRLEKKDGKRIAKQDEILEFLTKVLRGEVTEQVPITMKDYWQMAEKEPSVKDRVKAAEQLGKRYGMWTENHNITGEIGVQIIDDIGSDKDDSAD